MTIKENQGIVMIKKKTVDTYWLEVKETRRNERGGESAR